jgi:hypothetical protein
MKKQEFLPFGGLSLQVECQKFNMCQKDHNESPFPGVVLPEQTQRETRLYKCKQTPYKSSVYELKIYHSIEIILLVLRGNYYSSSLVVFV